MSSRLVLDAARCTGHGICTLRCPERISLDEWGFAKVDPAPLAGRGELGGARRAVAACPERALSLEDAPESASRPAGGTGG